MDALGQRVRDRFNEELSENVQAPEHRASGGIHHRTLKQLRTAHELGDGVSVASSKASGARSSVWSRTNPMRKRRHTANAHEKQVAYGGEEHDLNDRESVIT